MKKAKQQVTKMRLNQKTRRIHTFATLPQRYIGANIPMIPPKTALVTIESRERNAIAMEG